VGLRIEPSPTKVSCGRSVSMQMVAYFVGKTGHVATVSLEQRRTVNFFSWSYRRNSKKEHEKTYHCASWECKLAHISSNQRLFDRPKALIDVWSTEQPWLGTQWILFIPAHQEKNSWSTIFIARIRCWCVQSGSVSVGVKKVLWQLVWGHEIE